MQHAAWHHQRPTHVALDSYCQWGLCTCACVCKYLTYAKSTDVYSCDTASPSSIFLVYPFQVSAVGELSLFVGRNGDFPDSMAGNEGGRTQLRKMYRVYVSSLRSYKTIRLSDYLAFPWPPVVLYILLSIVSFHTNETPLLDYQLAAETQLESDTPTAPRLRSPLQYPSVQRLVVSPAAPRVRTLDRDVC